MIPSGVSSVQRILQTSAEGMNLGHTRLVSTPSGFVVSPYSDPNSYSPVLQEIGDDSVYIKDYDARETIVVNDVDTLGEENPLVQYTPNKNVTVVSVKIKPQKDIQYLRASMNDGSDEIWAEPFYGIKAGDERELSFAAPIDLKGNEDYYFRFTGISEDGENKVILLGTGTDPYFKVVIRPWTGKELATKEWVNTNIPTNGQGGTTVPKNDVLLDSFSDTNYSPQDSEFLGRPVYFVYKGSAQGTLNLIDTGDIPSGENVVVTVINPTSNQLLVSPKNTDTIGKAGVTQYAVPAGTGKTFVSDKANGKWHTIDDPGSQQSVSDVLVKDISVQANGAELLVSYSNGTNTTLTLDGAYAADISALKAGLARLERRIVQRTKFFVYRGTTAPTIPTGTRGGYYLTFYGLSGNVDTTTPASASTLPDGTVFFVENSDDTYNINVTSGRQGETFDSSSSVTVLPNTVNWMIKDGTNWHTIFSGYIPATYKRMISEVKSSLLADNSFLTDVRVQSDDPSANVLDCDRLTFSGCEVKADPLDKRNGIISVPDEITFVNQDGTSVSNNKFKLVGMEIKDPLDGTPPKILLLNSQNVPQPHSTSAYAFFDASPTTPNKVTFQSLPLFQGGRVTIHKDTTDPQYAYIMLPPGEGTDAERVGELGGLPAYWSKELKNYVIGGQQRSYTVLRSPYPFTEKDVTLVIYP